MNTVVAVTIEVDTAKLAGYADEHLAMLWHVAQANPADGFAEFGPGDLAEQVGREIIRRWLAGTRPELWHHQGKHYYWSRLGELATYQPGGPAGDPSFYQGTWVPRPGQAGQAEERDGGEVR